MDVFLEDVATGLSVESALAADVCFAEPLRSITLESLVEEAQLLERRRIRHVVVRRQQILQIGALRLQEILNGSGIAVNCVGFAGGFTGTLGRSFREALDDTQRALDVACELGARALVVLPGEQGLHTYRHAERTVREGLLQALDRAVRLQMRMLVPTDTVLLKKKDCFRPRERCPLNWIMGFDTHEIRPIVIVRGAPDAWRLPAGWLECLASGGRLRICHWCANYSQNSRLMIGILRRFAMSSGASAVEEE